MKYALLTAVAAFFLTLVPQIPAAYAVKCKQGANYAGCAGPHGAAVAKKPQCVVRNGVRVCK
jgi:hypothetical protein